MLTPKEKLALHRTIQSEVKRLLTGEEVFLEHPFPGHYADVYWPAKKIVFEIQCSKILVAEVVKRTRDYESFGLHVVWILHQKVFNKKSLTPAEIYLRTRNAYFTSIYTNGTGEIYDQDEVIDGHLRLFKGPPKKVDLTLAAELSWSKTLRKRLTIDALWFQGKKRGLKFPGDRHTRSIQEKARLFLIASALKPLYKKFAHGESSLTMAICFFLRLGHSLLQALRSGKDSASKSRNRRALRRQWQASPPRSQATLFPR